MNNSAAVFHSDATYAGLLVGSDNPSFTNAPFSSADLGEDTGQIQARTVAYGIRVRYVGTELQRGGTITTLEHPNHGSTFGLSLSDLQLFDNAETQQVDREWHSVTWQPISATELQYTITSQPIRSGSSNNGAHVIAILLTGVPGVIYEWEVAQHIEYTGTAARGKQPSATSAYFDTIVNAVSNLSSAQISKIVNQSGNVMRAANQIYQLYQRPPMRRLEYL